MTGISISWVEIGAVVVALAGAVTFLFRHIATTNAARIESYKKVVEDLQVQLRAKEAKIEALYQKALSSRDEAGGDD